MEDSYGPGSQGCAEDGHLMFELDDDWFQNLLHQTIGAQLLGQVFLRCPFEDVCG